MSELTFEKLIEETRKSRDYSIIKFINAEVINLKGLTLSYRDLGKYFEVMGIFLQTEQVIRKCMEDEDNDKDNTYSSYSMTINVMRNELYMNIIFLMDRNNNFTILDIEKDELEGFGG